MKIVYLIAICALIGSCSPKSNELDVLKSEVMKAHDEVMPRMGELMKTQKALKLKADSVSVFDSLASVSYLKLASDIDAANESMMNWMRNFEPNFTGTEAEVLQYYTDQKKAIDQVKADMLNSLEAGKKGL